MKTCREAAAEWGISTRMVSELCKRGRIPGAVKQGRAWKIPESANKPDDGRISSGRYVKSSSFPEKRKPLPVGISDYVRAQADYYYVDKTLLIKEFLDRRSLVTLFTRPRRFGKTLNMDMLRVFFEISGEDTEKYFYDKKIWQCGETYLKHQGRYPVIYLSFKDVKFDTWEATFAKIAELLQEEFSRHSELENSDRIEDYERAYYLRVLNSSANEVELSSSLQKLSKMLSEHWGTAPVIIIDEYDTPIQEGYSKEFYDEITSFMRIFFSGAFKDNRYLSYGFLTGILRIAQESIFSGMNNLSVNTVMDDEYDTFFGFTAEEAIEILDYYGVYDKYDELKTWYDGYLFGSTEIYNPWSVISYISKGCLPQAYWVNTGKNEILGDALAAAADDTIAKINLLMQGDTVIARIDQNLAYGSLADDPANIYSLLLVAGYLRTVKKELQGDGTWLCEVDIPNQEITAVYKTEILSHLIHTGALSRSTANRIVESLYALDTEGLRDGIAEYMDRTISFYDTGTEGFYHGMLLGLVALTDSLYVIKSNRESGDGRYDISLFPRDMKYPGIIIELKSGRDLKDDALESLAKDALTQIVDRRYDEEMRQEGIANIMKLGIAFSGKKIAVSKQ